MKRVRSQGAWTGDVQSWRPKQTGLKSKTRVWVVCYTAFSCSAPPRRHTCAPFPSDGIVYTQREAAAPIMTVVNASVFQRAHEDVFTSFPALRVGSAGCCRSSPASAWPQSPSLWCGCSWEGQLQCLPSCPYYPITQHQENTFHLYILHILITPFC